jgi:hypothetical protein
MVTRKGGSFDGRYNALSQVNGNTNQSCCQIARLEFFGIYKLANGSNEFTQPQMDKEGGSHHWLLNYCIVLDKMRNWY